MYTHVKCHIQFAQFFPVFQSLSRPISQNIPPKQKEGHLLLLPSSHLQSTLPATQNVPATVSRRWNHQLVLHEVPGWCRWVEVIGMFFSNPDEVVKLTKKCRGGLTWHDRLQRGWKSDRKWCFPLSNLYFLLLFFVECNSEKCNKNLLMKTLPGPKRRIHK